MKKPKKTATEVAMEGQEREKQERILMLAERVRLLFSFCADLIPDRDLIKETAKLAADRQSNALAMAPILGAAGLDYEVAEQSAKMHKERAEALYNLLEVLYRTEVERAEFACTQDKKKKGRADLAKMLGL